MNAMICMDWDWIGLLAAASAGGEGPQGVFGRLGDAEAWFTLLGRLHVVVVHFPIALVIVGVLIELLRLPRRKVEPPRKWRPSGAGLTCVVIGALAAGFAAWSGWVYASELGDASEITAHRWVGLAAAGASGLAAALGLFVWKSPDRGRLAGYRFVGLVAAVLVGVAGHLGGNLTHGAGHLTGPLRAALGMAANDAGAPPEPEAADEPAPASPPAPEAVDPAAEPAATPDPETNPETGEAATPDRPMFAGAAQVAFAQVEPILAGSCYRCHGAQRQRGDLRLDTEGGLLSSVVAGDVAASELHRRITLPPDDRKSMPRSGDPLTAEEIAAIATWIEAMGTGGEGAMGEGAGAEPARRAPDEPAPPAPMPELTDAQRAQRDAALAQLQRRGLVAQVVAQGVDACEVRFAGTARFADDELALLDGLQNSLVWLDLTASGITDAGAAELAAFSHLRRLKLAQTTLSDAALGALGDLEELESLDLRATKITGAQLGQLAGLHRLRLLHMQETQVTAEDAARLRAQAPWINIDLGE